MSRLRTGGKRAGYLILFFVFAGGLLVSSCKVRQKSPTPIVREQKKPEDKTAPDLQELITRNSFVAKTVSAKASVKTDVGGRESSFNINLRMIADSAIWISISPLLGIEVARVLITRDSVKFIDRLNNKYSVSDFQLLNQLLNVNLDFDIIQGVLTGNLFAYKKHKFNSVYVEDKFYILSTLSKRKLKRSLEEIENDKPVVQDVYVNDSTYRVMKLNIEDNRSGKALATDYMDHKPTEGGLFPYQSNTRIKAEKDIHIQIEYTRLNLNTDIELPFTIPKGFTPVR